MAEIDQAWPSLPTETEIYILPNGEIVIADLPAELAARLAHLLPGQSAPAGATPTDTTPTDTTPTDTTQHVPNQQHSA